MNALNFDTGIMAHQPLARPTPTWLYTRTAAKNLLLSLRQFHAVEATLTTAGTFGDVCS